MQNKASIITQEGSVITDQSNSSMVEFGSYLTEQNMLNYFNYIFNEEPTKISPLAAEKWKELPRMAFTHVQNTQIVAQRFD